MWILALALYLLTGVTIITCTSAKQEMQKLGDGITRPRHIFEPAPQYPVWKIVAFFFLAYAGAVVAWPIFLRSWFPRREVFDQDSTPTELKSEIPKGWLTRQLTQDEVSEWQWEFRNQAQQGDEFWEFNSPDHFWKNLAGSAGIALVRDGEIVATRITMLN